jgi:hypothetical protein
MNLWSSTYSSAPKPIAGLIKQGQLNSGKWDFCHTAWKRYLGKLISSPGDKLSGRMPACGGGLHDPLGLGEGRGPRR